MKIVKRTKWFNKMAQELIGEPMELKETGVPGLAGKSMPMKGYPYRSIRELADRLLRRLRVHPAVPKYVKSGTSSFGDLLSDFNNNRFSDRDLNYYWGDYIVALMNKANGLVQTAASEGLSDFYKSFVEDLGDLFDDIKDAGWETKVKKPMVAEFVGAAENPFKSNDVMGKPKSTLVPSKEIKDTVENIAVENQPTLKNQEGPDLVEQVKGLQVKEPKLPKIQTEPKPLPAVPLSTQTMLKYRLKK